MGKIMQVEELVRKRDALLVELAKLEECLCTLIAETQQTPIFVPPPLSVPIRADVREFNFKQLAARMQFDVILMDPPWQLATNTCTRGVHISYAHLTDLEIMQIPLHSLQPKDTPAYIFIWTINNKYSKCLELLNHWGGYELIDEVAWVKSTVNRRLAKGHGYYLQHAKETCLVACKNPPKQPLSIGTDVIVSERRGQSQKPEEIYWLIESLVPNGRYLEIFGRRNNLRNNWVTIGNEL